MGVRERLVVFEDGSVRLERWPGRGGHDSFCARLERKRLEDLRGTLELAGLRLLAPEYLPKHPVHDGYTYSITYRGHTVRTQDPIEHAAPPRLGFAIHLLEKILQDVLGQKRVC